MRSIFFAIPGVRPGLLPVLFALTALVVRWLKQLARARKHRRQARALTGLEQNMLADIGLTHADVRDAFSGPLWEDPTALLRARALERRLARHGISTGFKSPVGGDALGAPRSDRPARLTA